MRLAILGSTGSIGHSALAVVDAHADRLQVIGLAAGTSAPAMALQVERYRPRAVVMATDAACQTSARSPDWGGRPPRPLRRRPQAPIDLVTRDDVDTVLCASSGTAALEAVVAAIRSGKRIALANKEVLVMAGRLVMDLAGATASTCCRSTASTTPSTSACTGAIPRRCGRLILTASGGPFRHLSAEALAGVTVDALSHPTCGWAARSPSTRRRS